MMAGVPDSHTATRTATSRYRFFASVRITHDYFADGRARHMVFSPRADTAAFLQRFDMRVHADGHNLGISVCDAQWPGIWSERMDDGEPRTLCFDVRSVDPACAYYTAAVTAASQLADEVVHPALLQAVVPSASAPLATLALPLDASATDDFSTWTAGLGTSYRLHMCSRSTVWKYVLLGHWRDRKLAVADQRGEVAFTTPSVERMPDGRQVLVTCSTSPIILQERPTQRFQLRDMTDSAERILIPRLPAASPQCLWRETRDGTSTVVSEIFVHC